MCWDAIRIERDAGTKPVPVLIAVGITQDSILAYATVR